MSPESEAAIVASVERTNGGRWLLAEINSLPDSAQIAITISPTLRRPQLVHQGTGPMSSK